jgi:hypothetical protein
MRIACAVLFLVNRNDAYWIGSPWKFSIGVA